jgi:hypothetical protein
VGDHTPNVGLFWYFFTEMFEHFRLFFVCVFSTESSCLFGSHGYLHEVYVAFIEETLPYKVNYDNARKLLLVFMNHEHIVVMMNSNRQKFQVVHKMGALF